MDKDQQIKELHARIDELICIVKKLTAENAKLKKRLARYENPKNSRNISIPPSKDENRSLKTKSLREKSNKRIGGQPDRKEFINIYRCLAKQRLCYHRRECSERLSKQHPCKPLLEEPLSIKNSGASTMYATSDKRTQLFSRTL